MCVILLFLAVSKDGVLSMVVGTWAQAATTNWAADGPVFGHQRTTRSSIRAIVAYPASNSHVEKMRSRLASMA